jgi:hypothetical protein
MIAPGFEKRAPRSHEREPPANRKEFEALGRGRRGGVRGIAGLGAAPDQRLRALWAGWPIQGRTRQQQGRILKLQSGGRELERGVSGLRTGRALAITTSRRAHSKYGVRTRTARLRSPDNDNARVCRLLCAFARARVHRSAPLGHCMAPPTPRYHLCKGGVKSSRPAARAGAAVTRRGERHERAAIAAVHVLKCWRQSA